MKRVMTVEGSRQQKGKVQVGIKEPNTEMGKPVGHSTGVGINPKSKRELIAVKARNSPKEQFNNLIHQLHIDLVKECILEIPKSSAPGNDGMTAQQARDNMSWLLPPLLSQIHEFKYEAPPVRRVYIPKPDGKQRPIGIPDIVDRSIQAAMSKILNEIYEQDFLNCSFGFRPNLGCHHALATVNALIGQRKMYHVLEVDIRDFFGSLDHKWLRKFLELRIKDQRVLNLIDGWLKAGVMELGEWKESVNGSPQGGSISPLMSNIYLHYVLDLWFEKKIKPQYKGNAHLVRYADDFCVFFNEKADLESFKTLLAARLNQFGLVIAEDKTHITDLTPRENAGRDRRRIATSTRFVFDRLLGPLN
jgi:group II intron reverse transcriptase/maturase